MGGMSEEERILQNLRDAGCNEDTIKRFFCLQKDGRRKEQYRLLSMHKALLLEQLHVSQQKIDCLDYLVYAMKKEEKNNDYALLAQTLHDAQEAAQKRGKHEHEF